MDSDFPMHFVESTVELINCFRFQIPQADIGRDDIIIYVEYGVEEKNKDKIHYNVWCQIKNQPIRAYLSSDVIVGNIEDETTIQSILSAINESNDFYDMLDHFIEVFD